MLPRFIKQWHPELRYLIGNCRMSGKSGPEMTLQSIETEREREPGVHWTPHHGDNWENQLHLIYLWITQVMHDGQGVISYIHTRSSSAAKSSCKGSSSCSKAENFISYRFFYMSDCWWLGKELIFLSMPPADIASVHCPLWTREEICNGWA